MSDETNPTHRATNDDDDDFDDNSQAGSMPHQQPPTQQPRFQHSGNEYRSQISSSESDYKLMASEFSSALKVSEKEIVKLKRELSLKQEDITNMLADRLVSTNLNNPEEHKFDTASTSVGHFLTNRDYSMLDPNKHKKDDTNNSMSPKTEDDLNKTKSLRNKDDKNKTTSLRNRDDEDKTMIHKHSPKNQTRYYASHPNEYSMINQENRHDSNNHAYEESPIQQERRCTRQERTFENPLVSQGNQLAKRRREDEDEDMNRSSSHFYTPATHRENYNNTNKQQQPRSSKLPNSQTFFHGRDDEDLTMWLYRFNLNLRIAQASEDEKVTHAGSWLQSRALQVFMQAVARNPHISWSSLQDELMRAFIRRDNVSVLQTKLQYTKQTGALQPFIEQFELIANKLGENMPEKTKIIFFEQNVKHEISQQLRYRSENIYTLSDAVNMALHYDTIYGSNQQANSTPPAQVNYYQKSNSKYCSHCRRKGHTLEYCRSKDSASTQSGTNSCAYCKRTGHNINSPCYTKMRDESAGRQQTQDQQQNVTQPNQKTYPPCSHCHKNGHGWKVCRKRISEEENKNTPQQRQQQQQQNKYNSGNSTQQNKYNNNPQYKEQKRQFQTPQVDNNKNRNGGSEPMDQSAVQLNMVQFFEKRVSLSQKHSLPRINIFMRQNSNSNPKFMEETAVLDSGAQISCISEETAKNNNLIYTEFADQIKVANGGIFDVHIAREIEIKLGNHRHILDFYIVPGAKIPVLLGANWLRLSKANLIVHSNTLIIDRDTFKINSHLENDENYDPDDLCLISEIGIIETVENSTKIKTDENTTKMSLVCTSSTTEENNEQTLCNNTTTGKNMNLRNENSNQTQKASTHIKESDSDDEFWLPKGNNNSRFEIKNCPLLSDEQNKIFKKTIEENRDVFAECIEDLSSPCSSAECVITMREKHTRFYRAPFKRSQYENEMLKQELDRMLKTGIIRESRSEFSSPIFIKINKENGKHRIIIDCRDCNAGSLPEPFPLPNINDLLHKVASTKSTFYSKLDFKNGFFQIAMHPDSIKYTAFSTTFGRYEFLRMPFGLQNGTFEFCRLMARLFDYLAFMAHFVDDICFFSKTFEEHIEHMEKIFKICRENSLKINIEKCDWFKDKIKLLGHIISHDALEMDPSKIEAIQNWKTPTTAKQILSFLGLAGYYRNFIHFFGPIAKPMYDLTCKDAKWNWDTNCEAAFNKLKTLLTSDPILKPIDYSLDFILYCDASGVGCGAILSQKAENGSIHNCMYMSRTFKGAELHYSATEKECLAVVWPVKKCRNELIHKHFTIVTDHTALQWLISLKDPIGKLARWGIYMQEYRYTIKARPGKTHKNADALSRATLAITLVSSQKNTEFLPPPNHRTGEDKLAELNMLTMKTSKRAEEHEMRRLTKYNNAIAEESDLADEFQDENISSANHDPYEDALLMQFLRTGEINAGASKNEFKRIRRIADHYILVGETISYRKDTNIPIFKQKIPLKDSRFTIIKNAHSLGHFAAHETYLRIYQKYYWRKMLDDVKHAISMCPQCVRHKKTRVEQHPALAQEVTGMFHVMHADLQFGWTETSRGNIGLFVMQDHLTKYGYAVPIEGKTAEITAREFDKYCSLFGAPKIIVTDAGKEWLNNTFEALCKIQGIKHVHTSPYSPWVNGLVEKFNGVIAGPIKKSSEHEPEKWDEHVPAAIRAYNSRIHSVTHETPYALVFGQEMIVLGEMQEEETGPTGEEKLSLEKRTIEIKKKFEYSHPRALDRIEAAQEKQIITQNKAQNVREKPLENGTKVMIRSPQLMAKQLPIYHGPYTVKGQTKRGNYWLTNKKGKELQTAYNLNRLKTVNQDYDGEEYAEVEKIIDSRTRKG